MVNFSGAIFCACIGMPCRDTIIRTKERAFRAFETKEVINNEKIIPIVCISILSVGISFAQDPVKVDPAHYKVILNNSNVRVLDIRVKPGEKTPMHSHPNYVVYSFTNSTVKFTLPDGKTNTGTMKAGEAKWQNAETHAGENVGKTPVHVLNIELKK